MQRVFIAVMMATALWVAQAGISMAAGKELEGARPGIEVSCSQENETADALKKLADWLKASGLSSLVDGLHKPVRTGKVRCIDIMKSLAGAA